MLRFLSPPFGEDLICETTRTSCHVKQDKKMDPSAIPVKWLATTAEWKNAGPATALPTLRLILYQNSRSNRTTRILFKHLLPQYGVVLLRLASTFCPFCCCSTRTFPSWDKKLQNWKVFVEPKEPWMEESFLYQLCFLVTISASHRLGASGHPQTDQPRSSREQINHLHRTQLCNDAVKLAITMPYNWCPEILNTIQRLSVINYPHSHDISDIYQYQY